MKLDKKEREKTKKQGYLTARQEAQRLWKQASKDDIEHEYLTKKQVQAFGIGKLKNMLLIPMRDIRGKLWNLQRIYPSKVGKFYLKGGCVLKVFHLIGKITDKQGVIRICEGYATGQSIFQMTNEPTVVAFSTANLAPVGLVIRKAYPLIRIIYCGDDDRFSTGINAGRAYAVKAAEMVRGEVIFPTFPDECKGTDFNDLCIWEANHGKS